MVEIETVRGGVAVSILSIVADSIDIDRCVSTRGAGGMPVAVRMRASGVAFSMRVKQPTTLSNTKSQRAPRKSL